MKYFGRLKNTDLSNLDEEKKHLLYLKRRLFEKQRVVPLSELFKSNESNNNFKVVLEPNKKLILEYYEFLKDHYSHFIEDNCMLYLHPFNKITFGMGPKEKKKEARQYYLYIADAIKEKSVEWIGFNNSARGTKRIVNSTPLEDCYDKRTTLASRAIKDHQEGLEHFLMGKKEYFTSELIANVPVLTEIIKFQGGLQSLLDLNEDFSFEEDRFFNVSTKKEKEPLDSENKKLGKKSRQSRMPTDEEAKKYLIDTLFRKKS